ncbi:tRNA (adenine(22)-N(1))-methyltransferase [Alkalibacillus aidingensis]|uniref:tRNA (adenine(22)-N(1))-methyltransferase n=1 Tax=Alkalibacillus aidingensis TaxID=2747607 RepID=UPI001660E239|nr:tRNA (adenine(22)-N(1))-methyltransferase TrmK [Alkalibacillus aidingensis]
MTGIQLSTRLERVKKYITDQINAFADIGSDHAYLPCQVCLEHPNIKAIAGEVNQGPYQAAVTQVQKENLQDRIDVRLGDGLNVIAPNEVECVTIAGMGGTLITSILENGLDRLEGANRLILQPNIDASSIRQFAIHHQYEIINEEILSEDGYIYEIIVLEPTSSPIEYTAKEVYLGPKILENKNQAFASKWRKVYDKKKSIIKQMKQAKEPDQSKIEKFEQQLEWIEEEL